jgi:ankyrin repeat protein
MPATNATALLDAIRACSVEAVARLLDQGANPNVRDPDSTLTPLMFASGAGMDAILGRLIAAGAFVNALDGRAGASALHKACQGGHLGCAQQLVEHGACIDLQTTTTGHTPLVEAIWFKADDIVAYLLAREARIELKTYYGFTLDDHINYALNVSQGTGDQDKLRRIQQLVADRRARDKARCEAAVLVKAALKGDGDDLRRALTAGAEVDVRYPIVGSFQDGHTALLVAAREGHAELVEVLMAAGADVNAVEPVFGAVPLHKATYNGRADITRTLASAAGVDLNYQGASNGYTPLHDALWHGFADCAEILIDAGARSDIVAYDGKRPLDLAIEKLGSDHPVVGRLRAAAAVPA